MLKTTNKIMKYLTGILLLITLSRGWADSIEINIFSGLKSDPVSSITAYPGDFINVFTRFTVTNRVVLSLNYEIVLPTSDWEVWSRDYGSYDWDTSAILDSSVPRQGSSPTLITADTFAGPAIDFSFDTFGRDNNTFHFGTFIGEDITLKLPINIFSGTYAIIFGDNPQAFDDNFETIPNSAIRTLTVNVIPEPSTAILFFMAVPVIIIMRLYRRRRID